MFSTSEFMLTKNVFFWFSFHTKAQFVHFWNKFFRTLKRALLLGVQLVVTTELCPAALVVCLCLLILIVG